MCVCVFRCLDDLTRTLYRHNFPVLCSNMCIRINITRVISYTHIRICTYPLLDNYNHITHVRGGYLGSDHVILQSMAR